MMETKPAGIVVLVLAGWLDHPARPAWRTLDVLSEGRLMDGMNKFMLLDARARGFRGCADPANGELRVTLLAGEGPIQGWVLHSAWGR